MGAEDPALYAELIQLFADIAPRGGGPYTPPELNSIGDHAGRPRYIEPLRSGLADHRDGLDDDPRRKAETSPLRVFDTKNPSVQESLAQAPTIGESLCGACREHFDTVRACLDAYGIGY